jgi:hypothetical protein
MRLAFMSWTARGLGIVLVLALVATRCGGSPSIPSPTPDPTRFVDQGATVLDTKTNLIWEKKSVGFPSDVDYAFTWCEATGCAGSAESWIDGFRNTARNGSWRIPTRAELQSIVQGPCPRSSFSPCIDPVFGGTAEARYWSSEESSDASAYSVSFTNGQVITESKSARNRVRAVRSGP